MDRPHERFWQLTIKAVDSPLTVYKTWFVCMKDYALQEV